MPSRYIEWYRWNPDREGFCEAGPRAPAGARNVQQVKGVVDARVWGDA